VLSKYIIDDTSIGRDGVRERHALDKRLLVFVGHNVPLHLDAGANVKPRRPMVSHTHCTAVRGCKHESLGEQHPNFKPTPPCAKQALETGARCH
jgi:hypothetical protein